MYPEGIHRGSRGEPYGGLKRDDPERAQRGSRGNPERTQRGSRGDPKRTQRGSREDPARIQRRPRDQRGAREDPVEIQREDPEEIQRRSRGMCGMYVSYMYRVGIVYVSYMYGDSPLACAWVEIQCFAL